MFYSNECAYRICGKSAVSSQFNLLGLPAPVMHELAQESGIARASFAVHFKTTRGRAPLAYLANWSMHLAERALRDGDNAISSLGHSLGMHRRAHLAMRSNGLLEKLPRANVPAHE